MLYGIVKGIAWVLLKVLFWFRTEGQENVPKDGPLVVAGNHVSYLDPIVVGVGMPRRVNFISKAELFTIPVLSSLIRGLGAFPVQRGGVDRRALVRALQVLREEKVLGIFPEGTRSEEGEKLAGKSGAATLALKTGADILPVAVIGTGKVLSKKHFFRFSRVTLRIGKVIHVGKEPIIRKESVTALTTKVMESIQDLLEEG